MVNHSNDGKGSGEYRYGDPRFPEIDTSILPNPIVLANIAALLAPNPNANHTSAAM